MEKGNRGNSAIPGWIARFGVNGLTKKRQGVREIKVVFELVPDEKPALDRAEGLGAGYMDKTVQVSTDAGPVTAVMYYAIDKDPSLRPYHWYKALVIAGAREHGLPAGYRSRLELVVTVSDHNPTRAGTSGDPLSGPRRTS